MPTMFDSHDEFSEWFSKDIENHAEKKSALDESECRELCTEPHVTLDPLSLSLSVRSTLSSTHDPKAIHVEKNQERCRTRNG